MKVEEKFELLKNGELDKQIQDYKDFTRLTEIERNFGKRLSMGITTPEEELERNELKIKLEGKDEKYLQELDGEKLLKIKENMPKIENILDLKRTLEQKRDSLKQEAMSLVEFEKDLQLKENNAKHIEEKNSRITKRIVELQNKWVITEDERKEFSELQDELNENTKKQEELSKTKNPQYKGRNKEEIAKDSFKVYQKISMCNLACKEMLEGKNIDDIEVDKNIKGKRFKVNNEWNFLTKAREASKTSVKETIKAENPAETIEANDLEQKIVSEYEKMRAEELSEEKSLVKKETFLDRHPRMKKFVEKMKKIFTTPIIKIEEIEDENIEKAEREQGEVEENRTEELNIPDARNQFVKYLKDAAENGKEAASQNYEKGLEEAEQKRKEDLKARGKEKLEQAKKDAIARQNAKYGNNYSEKSGDER